MTSTQKRLIALHHRFGKGGAVLQFCGDEIQVGLEGFFRDRFARGATGEASKQPFCVPGLILRNEELAAKITKIADHLLGSLEDAREAAPLSSLGTFLFGAI